MLIALATLTLAACLVSFLVVIAGFRQRRGRPEDRFATTLALAPSPEVPTGLTDAAAELQGLLPSFAPLVAHQLVDMDVAIQPTLLTGVDAKVIRNVFSAVLSDTLHRAAYGRVLLSAMRLEPWIHIALTDDVTDGYEGREAHLRDLAEALALQGGSLAIETRREGATVTIRLPSATPAIPVAPPVVQPVHHQPLPHDQH